MPIDERVFYLQTSIFILFVGKLSRLTFLLSKYSQVLARLEKEYWKLCKCFNDMPKSELYQCGAFPTKMICIHFTI